MNSCIIHIPQTKDENNRLICGSSLTGTRQVVVRKKIEDDHERADAQSLSRAGDAPGASPCPLTVGARQGS